MSYWKSLTKIPRITRKWSGHDWLTLIEAWLNLLAARVMIQFTRCEQLIDSPQEAGAFWGGGEKAQAEAERLGTLIRYAAAAHIPPVSCLPRALALNKMLAARGIPSQVQIGGRKVNQTFHAHAWVQVNGRVVAETEDVVSRFNIMKRI